ncbi:MAG TPA: biotin/lipoyl-containing protein [Candidatus Limnocylindria bacterium]|nr:biotin/lipoyl-containing protein [Candidatus Limnocylindria bacterium]
MNDFEVVVDGSLTTPADGWRLEWVDPGHGIARLVGDGRSVPVLVEGAGTDWVVTLAGRRIPVTVRSWRERILAAAETAAQVHGGPVEVRASLPGLVVSVAVSEGDEVADGASLLTIEAMKMQNEVRATRAGRVLEVQVAAGQTVAAGTPLLRLE